MRQLYHFNPAIPDFFLERSRICARLTHLEMNLPSANLASASTMITESPLRDLEAIIRSRTPLIAMESNEEPQIVRMVRQIAQKFQLRAYRWTVTEGLQAFEPMDQPLQTVTKSQEVLSYIKNSSNNCLFV